MAVRIQFLNGGLANQVFQYIFARYYELSHPGETMYLDDSYFANNTIHNGYELQKVFGLKPRMISEVYQPEVWQEMLRKRKEENKSISQIMLEYGVPSVMIAENDTYTSFNPFAGQIYDTEINAYHPEIMDVSFDGIIYYHGYWINVGYFAKYADIFRKELTFPAITDEKNIEYLRQIKTTKSVSIHVRRGDYVSLDWAYNEAVIRGLNEAYIDVFGADWTLFVFSDDIVWCKEHAEELGMNLYANCVYVEGNIAGKNYIDMQLMSECRGMILSNSSFCYLAALLNKNKDCIFNITDREIV